MVLTTEFGRFREVRDDLALLNRVGLVAAVALVSAVTNNSVALLATVLSHTAWPISVLAPMHWREEISQEAYMRASLWFLPGFATVTAAAYGASRGDDFPATALVICAGAVHLLVVLLAVGRRRELPWVSMGLGASVAGIAGAIADLPTALGWDAIAMATYGLIGVGAVAATRSHLRDQNARWIP